MTESTLKRVKRFKLALEKLEKISKLSFEEYDGDTDKQDITERNLEVAIQAIIDIGQKIISAQGWEIPETYKDVITVLGDRGVITSDFSGEMKELASMRNIIIHAYAEIKNEIVHEVLTAQLSTLRTVMETLLKYCEENEIDP